MNYMEYNSIYWRRVWMKTVNNINLAASSAYAKPLKWHKFLIYFAMWVWAINSIATGINMLSGFYYGDASVEVYSYFPRLQKVDTVFAVIYLLFGIFTIFTRFRLSRFHKGSLKLFTWCLILQPIVLSLYHFFFFAHTTVLYESVPLEIAENFIACAIILVSSRIYYKKREELFA